jgi:hypothetical protein
MTQERVPTEELRVGTFEYHVAGLEDCIIATLKRRFGNAVTVNAYGGELTAVLDVEKALRQLLPQFPLVLVSYTDGRDEEVPAVAEGYTGINLSNGEASGEPLLFRHVGGFTCLVVDDNARGEDERRRGDTDSMGAYRMLSVIREELAGRRFYFEVADESEDAEEGDTVPYWLNDEPFKPAGVENVERLKGVTAYAAHFDCSWVFETVDRRGADVLVSQLLVDLQTSNAAGRPAEREPGVSVE